MTLPPGIYDLTEGFGDTEVIVHILGESGEPGRVKCRFRVGNDEWLDYSANGRDYSAKDILQWNPVLNETYDNPVGKELSREVVL